MQKIAINKGPLFEDYLTYGALKPTVNRFLENSKQSVEDLKGSTIWMINSTATGGGVAEMLPSQMRLLRQLKVKIEWLVLETEDEDFFNLTKRIHNAIHGSGDGKFSDEDRQIYESVNKQNLDDALDHIQDGDLVVIHDPQPLPLAKFIRSERDVKLVWRCHIGLKEDNSTTKNVWSFLGDYFDAYDHFVFSLESYTPSNITERTTIIPPAIDPMSEKNKVLHMQDCLNILHRSGIVNDREEIIYPFFKYQVRRVMPDGSFNSVNHNSNLDSIYRPTITQISRWDRLKGFKELMQAFINVKMTNEKKSDVNSIQYKRIKKSRLIMAGPDPDFVADDPEGMAVLRELKQQYMNIDPELQEDIAILLLPMDDPKENAMIVNALQSSSSIVAQNSIQEGFGLTATEAMWKQRPVLVSGAAGLVFQVHDGVHGRINEHPEDIENLAETIDEMLADPEKREVWGFNAQIRVVENFTLFSQLESWLKLLSSVKQA